MRECENVQTELTGYLRGSATSGQVRLHLQDCGECQKELGRLQRLDALLDRHLFTVKASPTLNSRFANRLAAEIVAEEETAEQRGWLSWLRPLLVPLTLAAAAAAIAVAIMPRTVEERPTAIASRPAPRAPEVRVATQEAPPASKPAAVARQAPPPAASQEDPEVYVDFDVIRHLDQIAPELVGGAAG